MGNYPSRDMVIMVWFFGVDSKWGVKKKDPIRNFEAPRNEVANRTLLDNYRY